MSDSMMERVYEAIRETARVAGNDIVYEEPELIGKMACAVIEAMREPSHEMLRGLLVHRGYDPDASENTLDRLGQLDLATMGAFTRAYSAMIDAALGTPP